MLNQPRLLLVRIDKTDRKEFAPDLHRQVESRIFPVLAFPRRAGGSIVLQPLKDPAFAFGMEKTVGVGKFGDDVVSGIRNQIKGGKGCLFHNRLSV
jgi:hypothetical protein